MELPEHDKKMSVQELKTLLRKGNIDSLTHLARTLKIKPVNLMGLYNRSNNRRREIYIIADIVTKYPEILGRLFVECKDSGNGSAYQLHKAVELAQQFYKESHGIKV